MAGVFFPQLTSEFVSLLFMTLISSISRGHPFPVVEFVKPFPGRYREPSSRESQALSCSRTPSRPRVRHANGTFGRSILIHASSAARGPCHRSKVKDV